MKRRTRLTPFLVALLLLAAGGVALSPSMNGQIGEQDYRIHLSGLTFDPKLAPKTEWPDSEAYCIVQFVGTLTRREQSHLRSTYGLRLTDYIPNLAYLERLSPQKREALSRDKLHRAHVLYEAKYKISPRIRSRAASRGARGDAQGIPLRVVLFPEAVDASRVSSLVKELWGQKLRRPAADARRPAKVSAQRVERSARLSLLDDRLLGGHMQLMFFLPSTEHLMQIAELEEVRWIEGVAEATIDGTVFQEGIPAGVIQSGEPGGTPVWGQGITGRGQLIGITDHPPDLQHCMLRDPANNPAGSSHRKVQGNRHTADARDHGMAVASIAAGRNANIPAPGLDVNKGIAYEARLSLDSSLDVIEWKRSITDVLSSQGGDGAYTHSNSWHFKDSSYTQVASDVDDFTWKNEQHLVCGSSGNKKEEPGPPATAKNALSVSASGNHPNHLQFGDGTSSSADGRRRPEICAPGCNIALARVTTGGSKCTVLPKPACASSWATPVIAAAGALVRQYYAEGWYPTGTRVEANKRRFVSSALVKATLLNSTVDMTGVPDYPSVREGWGLIQLNNTLFFAGGPRGLFVADVSHADSLHTQESRTYEVLVRDDRQPLKITLAWSDPAPASPGAGGGLVNNLNLVVTAPGGGVFLGNNIDPKTGFSFPGGNSDGLNNVEMVIVNRPSVGVWKITVDCPAARVVRGGQGFAVVASASLGADS